MTITKTLISDRSFCGIAGCPSFPRSVRKGGRRKGRPTHPRRHAKVAPPKVRSGAISAPLVFGLTMRFQPDNLYQTALSIG
jgi:hypothetical protein